jgi:hypothetical protein
MRKRLSIALLVALIALAASAGAGASSSSSSAVSAQVDSIATVTSSIDVVFQFDLYNCPAGNPITIVDWIANEPSRPDSGAAANLSDYGLSNGASVQHLTLSANSSSFLAGERWVGNGFVDCGAVAVPVAGSGQAKSLNGV